MNTTPHKATAEQWSDAGAFASDTRACLLELRVRVEALEAAANHPAKPDSSPAPASSLVERVAKGIGSASPWMHSHRDEARAAIREVVAWLRTGRLLWVADLLEKEADR